MMVVNFQISSDKSLLDVEKVHHAVKNSYWGGYRTPQQTKKTIEKCLCYGMYDEGDNQIAFARVLTDEVVFAYIMDVIVFENFRGMGLGKQLVSHILNDPKVKDVLTIALKTKDAHVLYEKYGFKSVGDSPFWMAIDKSKLV